MKKILIALAIVLLAFFFRFNNLNWDSNFHLHPDERFLTMVATSMKIPQTFKDYLNQKKSLMNPSNVGYGFFVYGHFPLILTKTLAVVYNLDNYDDLTILGRQLSAFFDLFIVILVIKTAKLLISKFPNFNKYQQISSIPYWAGFFYAIAVLPIQLSHFFAVDTFLNFFVFGSFYFILKFSCNNKIKYLLFSTIFFGLALACKVTAIFILPLNLFFLIKTVFVRKSLTKTVFDVFLYLFLVYFTVRFADPYIFQNSNIFDPTISKLFIENIKSLQNMTVKSMDNWFPPMTQWLTKNTVQHSLVNNIVFGLGIPQTILTLFGIGLILISSFKFLISKQISKNWQLLIILIWALGFFMYQSLQVTPTLRYFILLYPFFAIFASIGTNYLVDFKFFYKGKHLIYPKIISYIFIFISGFILLIWPLMFSSIYFHKHTRVEASEWIYNNLPNNSFILGESWDDSLPLGVEKSYGKQFLSDQLPIVDQDTPEKWQKMNMMLHNADYYILSSNRGWGSITTVPKKYPEMSQFYKLLLNDKLQYKKIKEFKPFYYKFFELPNSLVDESFTVYDHPTVLIYKNTKKNDLLY